jgi:acyl-CoA thioesterase I
MQRCRLGLFMLMLTVVQPIWARAGEDLSCELPSDLTTPPSPLVRAAAALATRNELNILALGSGSTVGDASGASGPGTAYKSPEGSFPRRMLEALQSTRPAQRFNLTVKGGRSMTAESMLPILLQELTAHHYDLVLWQTGTVEAVQGLRPDVLRGVLQEGAAAVEQAQADLVLIDPQYSRFLRANADLNPYETVLQQIASAPDVSLFHRFELTQTWVNSGQVDLERVSRDQRDKTISQLNSCLGHALARFVLTGAGEH